MEKTKDVVCGMEIDQGRSGGSYAYQGKTYYFCSARCRNDFSKNPGSFIKS